jgi:hypothetical protein
LDINELFLYPTQQTPPKESWRTWKTAIKNLCNPGGKLKQPLGPFLQPETIRWWLNAEANRLFRKGDPVLMFRKAPGKRTRACESKYILTARDVDIPDGVVPATASRKNEIAFITGAGELRSLLPTKSSEYWAMQNVTAPDNFDVEWAISDGN